MRYFLSAGEASGDLHGSALIREIRRLDPDASFCFMGGDLMQEAAGGLAPIIHYRQMAFMGIIPVLMHLTDIRKGAKMVQEAMQAFMPDVVIPIDYPGFHFKYVLPFAKEVIRAKVVYYIAPKVWAWKKWRIKTLKKYVDLQLSILPFEKSFFKRNGFDALYVGNPSAEYIEHRGLREKAYGNPVENHTIAILPGSRLSELQKSLPLLLEVAARFPHYTPIIAGAPGRVLQDYLPLLKGCPKAQVIFDQTPEILARSRVALVTSGTATLETALVGTPQVVSYTIGGRWLANFVFDHLFGVKYISLVNLIADRPVVKELFGRNFTVDKIAQALSILLDDTPERQLMIDEYRHVNACLGYGRPYASEQAAKAITSVIGLSQEDSR